jgi:hypothetical protein
MKSVVVFILGVCVGATGSVALEPNIDKPNHNKAANTNCVIDEVVRLANASAIMAPELLAPQSILSILQPHVRSNVTTYETDGVIVVSGVSTAVLHPIKTSIKVLIDETAPLSTAVEKVTQNLHKQRRCKLNGTTYDIYEGDLPLTKAKKFREVFNAKTR